MLQDTTQAALQQILAKLDGIERTAVAQGQALSAVQDSVRAVQQELQAVKADAQQCGEAMQQRMDVVQQVVQQDVQAVKTDLKSQQIELQDVVLFAREKRARVSEQAKKQRLFMDALYVVANVGYDKEVRAVFSLNRGTWTDFRLWSVIINDKVKHTVRKRRTRYEEDHPPAYYNIEYEETRLIHQVRVGRESSVLRLLRLGANVHITDKDGMTALYYASAAGRKGLVKALLAAGSKVDHADNHGWTSLMLASEKGYDECVKLLIGAKAGVNHASKHGSTSLFAASRGGYPECVKLLLAAKANVIYKDGTSALIQACEGEESDPRTEVIKLLLEAKADVNHTDDVKNTALMPACTRGNEAAVKLLIAAKADLERADEWGNTALINAFDRPEIVKLLIEAKADVNHASSEGYTALMIACENSLENSLAVVKLLLAVPGIDIEHASNDGETALSFAKAPKPDDDDEDYDEYDEDYYEPEEWKEILRKREERYQRRLSLVPLLEEKMRQQAIDAEVAAAVKRIDAAAANSSKNGKKGR